jgi:hypothetical protein
MGMMMSNSGGTIKFYDVETPNQPAVEIKKDGTMKAVKASAEPFTVVTASNITAGSSHRNILFKSLQANKTVTLPSAAGELGRVYKFQKFGTGNDGIVESTVSGEFIEGNLTSVSISGNHKGFELASDGSDWYMMSCSDNLGTDGSIS